MSGFVNPDFAVAGSEPGTAQGWTLSSSATLERVVLFSGRARERFDWTQHLRSLPAIDVVRAFFDHGATAVERFAPGWSNLGLLRSLPDTCVRASFDGEAAEDFEEQWSNDLFLWDFIEPDLAPAVFATSPVENFSTGWTSGFAWDWEELAAAPVRLPSTPEGFAGWPIMETL
jgi:hypothetical protein